MGGLLTLGSGKSQALFQPCLHLSKGIRRTAQNCCEAPGQSPMHTHMHMDLSSLPSSPCIPI